jgi:hypothetical protein
MQQHWRIGQLTLLLCLAPGCSGDDSDTAADEGDAGDAGWVLLEAGPGLDNPDNAASGCRDGLQNGDESDVDCGGICTTCADGLSCLTERDCASGVCTQLVCQAPACDDQVANGSETDVDCGGATLRATSRQVAPIDYRRRYIGFRCAR